MLGFRVLHFVPGVFSDNDAVVGILFRFRLLMFLQGLFINRLLLHELGRELDRFVHCIVFNWLKVEIKTTLLASSLYLLEDQSSLEMIHKFPKELQ